MLDASYGVSFAPYGAKKWEGQWDHGPGATLSLGRTPEKFWAHPVRWIAQRLGPLISVEHLRVPRQGQAFVVLSARLMIR